MILPMTLTDQQICKQIFGSSELKSVVYIIQELKTGKYYIGSHKLKALHPMDDIGVLYFTSSHDKQFVRRFKQNLHEFSIGILKITESYKQAHQYQSTLLRQLDVKSDQKSYNRCNNTSQFMDTTGFIVVRDNNNRTMQVKIDDQRYLSGELVAASKGTKWINNPLTKERRMVKPNSNIPEGFIFGSGVQATPSGHFTVIDSTTQQYTQISTDNDEIGIRYIPMFKDQITVVDPNTGQTFNVNRYDQRYVSGQLKGKNYGRMRVYIPGTKGQKLIDSTQLQRYIQAGYVRGRNRVWTQSGKIKALKNLNSPKNTN